MHKTSYHNFRTQLINGILSCPIIYINHYHYHLVDNVIEDIIASNVVGHLNEHNIMEYDNGQKCVVTFKGKTIDKSFPNILSAKSLLQAIANPAAEKNSAFKKDKESIIDKKRLFLFKGLTKELLGENEVSLMQNFASGYEVDKYDNLTTIIIVSPESVNTLPLALRSYTTVLEVSPPSVDEIRQLIIEKTDKTAFKVYPQKKYAEELLRTLQGLQLYEVKQTLKTALTLTNNRLNSRAINIALDEKKKIVKKSGIIEVIDTDVRFNDVGGLQVLQKDLEIKCKIFHNLGDAEKYNIPIPKGVLIIGMPGCGKSMIAQATANLFGVSLLRLDISRLMGKYVGESEANLRYALATAEAAHPCVLWIDEIEKAFAGSNNSAEDNDMLVMRMMGHFLTWMQERKTPVFIVATANDVMRPEFMRKGRFDEVYYVGFPNKHERAEILRKKIAKKYSPNNPYNLFDFTELGDCTNIVEEMEGAYGGFSGSEIECVLKMVVEAKFQEYLDLKEDSFNDDVVNSPIVVRENDFKVAIDRIKDTVMANHKGRKKDKDEYLCEKTFIERILEMRDTYNFVNASK